MQIRLSAHRYLGHTKPIFSFWSTPVYERHVGGRHIRTLGQEIATLFTMDKWLDNYKVMTSMNMTMQQEKVLINSTFQIGMWAVDQKLKINIIWYGLTQGTTVLVLTTAASRLVPETASLPALNGPNE